MRRTGAKLPRGNSAFPVAVIALTFLSIVYVLGVSRLGGWLAETFVAPVFRISETDEARESGAPGAAAETVVLTTRRLNVPAFSLYALQMGIFGSEENAKTQAAQLRELGAGGYIHADGDRYRVLAAGYADAESLKKVRAQLAGEGLESASYTVERPAGAWRMTAEADTLEAYQSALDYLGGLAGDLTALALAFDKEEQSVPDGMRALALLDSALLRAQSAFLLASAAGQGAEADAIAGCFALACAEMKLLAGMEESERSAFASALKHAQLRVSLQIAALFAQLAA